MIEFFPFPRVRRLAVALAAGAVLSGGSAPAIISSPYDAGVGFTAPQIINDIVGARSFYDAGYLGQNTIVANVEAGHIWAGHEVFDRSGLGRPNSPALLYNAAPDPVTAPELGALDFHATMVGNVLAGTGDIGGGNLSLFGAGLAPLATLWSGAIATTFGHDQANIGSFEISDASFLAPYRAFFEGSLGSRADVINSSWGFEDPAGTAKENRILDALGAANPTVAFVRAAGNSGAGIAPGVGFNGIVVGSLGGGADVSPFLRPSDFTSSGAADFFNPATGRTIIGVRAAVTIAAPGENFALAAYLQKTGSLADYWPTSDPSNNLYFVNQSGTSFASPVVAGGVALLKDVAHNDPNLSAQPSALDSRVMKSVLQAGATATVGWDNGQHVANGIVTTTQALDYAVGAGRLDLDTSWTIYADGTTDVPGDGGGTITPHGWDLGSVAAGAPNDYFFNLSFSGESEISVSLNWFLNGALDAATGDATYGNFADLNLGVWTVVGGEFAQQIASSESVYNNSEYLRFDVGGGSYGLRVTFAGMVYNLTGAPAGETYGLAWNVVAVPEPGLWGIVPGLLLMAFVAIRQRKRLAG